jgi:hypothetical protein
MEMKKIVIGVALISFTLIGAMAALPLLVPIWQQYRPRPVVPVDNAMRQQTIDTLVARVRHHYVFPDKAAQVETLLRRRQRDGASDAIADGEQLASQKKVAILIGPDTMSAPEDFAYTMQPLKRATLIGERSWGDGHPTFVYRLGDHFAGLIPNARTISPITNTKWECVGVIADIAAAPADALCVATAHLLRNNLKTAGVRPTLPTQ